MSESLNKIRSLDSDFLKAFKFGTLSCLLDMVINDHTLCMELRGDYVVIYYRGGALYTIKNLKNGNYEISFNTKYVSEDDRDGVEASPSIEKAANDVAKYKRYMDCYFSKHPKLERETQQLIVRENNYSGEVSNATDYFILDIEYAYNNAVNDDINARYDMLALQWKSTPQGRKDPIGLPIAFIEVKYGDNAMNSKDRNNEIKKAGIAKHIDDYISFRKSSDRIKVLAEDMSVVFEQKAELGLITYETNGKKISIDADNVEFLIICANHDPDKRKLKEELETAINKWRGSEFLKEIKVVRSSEMGYGLFAFGEKGGKYLYPSIDKYLEQIKD